MGSTMGMVILERKLVLLELHPSVKRQLARVRMYEEREMEIERSI